jgi:hypothetical protein
MSPRPLAGNVRRTLGIEALEPRLNLSGVSTIAAPMSIFYVPQGRIPSAPSTPLFGGAAEVSAPSTRSVPMVESLRFGATTVAAGATTVIPVDSFTAIANCRPETIPGLTSPDIGYVSADGAYVEYSVNSANGGMYTLNFGLASPAGAKVRLEVNGVFSGEVTAPASGGWASFLPASALIQLPAGASTIRFTSQNSTQYNLNNISLTSAQAATNVTSIGDTVTTLPITSYSAINNSQVEYQDGVPDIGYVSSNGAYVDYTVNVASAGNYTLAVNAGGWSNASFNIYSNGTKLAGFSIPASYSWRTGNTQTATVYLPAGVQTLRFVATGGTQYNLFSASLARQVTTPSAPSSYSTDGTPPSAGEVTVAAKWMTSFTELDIVGTGGNDTISVSQSGGTLTVVTNGVTRQYTGAFGDIAVWGGGGDDHITIEASVLVDARIYGGDGNDYLVNLTRGNATIVTFGGGVDTVGGNSLNTNYWVDRGDIVYAGSLEAATGHVHTIGTFYQPYSTSTVTNALDGANLVDPLAGGPGTSTRLTSSSFWGVTPKMEDINQGSVGDCYFLTVLQSLAKFQPDKLRTLAVDLGDGTYAVQFQRGGVTSFVRVDGDLATWGEGGSPVYNRPGSSGAQWASIMEKAYAYFRTGANSYASLDTGWMVAVYNDFGIAANGYTLLLDQNTFYNAASTALAANKPVDVGTVTVLTAGAPFIAKHTYSVVSVTRDSGGTVMVTLRNPWGSDGASYDGNPWDGYLTVPYSLLKMNCASGSILA